MPSRKTTVIEQIFRERYNEETGEIGNRLVMLAEVSEAIRRYNRSNPTRQLSVNNPANFFKDFVRRRTRANKNWPEYVLSKGFTGRQVARESACFEFLPLLPGQEMAFPPVHFAGPSVTTPRHGIESVSMPVASRRLGRRDEAWLIQVVVRLRIVEAHFALVSRRKITQVDLLQLNVKLSKSEIDALFLVQEEMSNGQVEEVLVTCEAKTGSDDILESQILAQARAALSMGSSAHPHVIPLAVKSVGDSDVYVVEFEEVDGETATQFDALVVACDSLFEIRPPVPGIK
jgi:hypothetical protein